MKLRFLLIGSIVCAALGILLVLFNHRHAVTSARAIIIKDQRAENVTQDIKKLENFVHDHMRTGVSFELTASYERAVEAAHAAAQPNVSGSVYSQAQAACKQKVATVQTKCIADYVAKNASPAVAAQIKLPDLATFTYTFSSTGWTPDLAGILLLASVCGLVLFGWLLLMRRPRII